jgi:hypothetical protein
MLEELKKDQSKVDRYALFWVVRAIDKKSRIEAPRYSIDTMNDNPMHKRFHKLIIKDGLPLLVEHLPLAKSCESIGRCPSCMGGRKIVEVIWELRKHQPLDL